MCYNIQNPRDMSIVRLHTMANTDMLYKRRMLQLQSIIYDIAPTLNQGRVVLQHTRLATKNNIDLNIANTQLYSNSPFSVGVQFWNNLPKATQELNNKVKFKSAISKIL